MWIDVCCMSCGGSILVNHTGGGIQIILDAFVQYKQPMPRHFTCLSSQFALLASHFAGRVRGELVQEIQEKTPVERKHFVVLSSGR